jgi:hypothetical protein
VIHHFFAISALNIDAVEKVSTVHVIPLNTLASFIEGCNSGSEQACDDSSNQKIHNCASGLLDSADVPWIADEHSRERPKQDKRVKTKKALEMVIGRIMPPSIREIVAA